MTPKPGKTYACTQRYRNYMRGKLLDDLSPAATSATVLSVVDDWVRYRRNGSVFSVPVREFERIYAA